MLNRVRIATQRSLIMVVIREQVSELYAQLKDFFHLPGNSIENPTQLSNLSLYFSKYTHKRITETSNLVLLDDFPIYRWVIPNFLLAHRIAGELNAKVGVFSFRRPTRSAKSLYRQLFVDELLVIKLNLMQKISLIREYGRFVNFIKENQSLIEYRINGIPIGLDIYESILRSGRPTVNLFELRTYRIAYLGLKQFIFFKTFFEQQKIKSILVSHDNYIGPGLLAHMAFHFKIEVILANLLSIAIPEKEFQLYQKFGRYQIYINHLNEKTLNEGVAWAKDQLSKRIRGSLGIGIKYQNKSAFDSEIIERQTSENSGTKVLVLTHDFFDNPHGYARMTFDDFYTWMDFLAKISHETDYEWYIKLHRDYSEIEFDILRTFLSTNTNFKIISSETSFYQLKSEGIDFVLTCFGTVGHELPLLGFTVINASYNPHSAFNFNVNAKSRLDYEKIIRNINDYKLSNMSFLDIYKFYFIHHQIVQDDQFMGVSIETLDSLSNGKINSDSELEYLLSNFDTIAENAYSHLKTMRMTGRIYAFEDFLPFEKQLRRGTSSISSKK